jgi:activating signal cointegrator 1
MSEIQQFLTLDSPAHGGSDQGLVRCLSLWQPWASLMACGAKFIETRGWNTKVRGEIYIHAGATKTPIREMLKAPSWWIAQVEEALDVCADKWLTDLPYGALIGKGNLISTSPVEWWEQHYPEQLPFGDFKEGRYGHFYERLAAIEPIPWKGSQGFFFATLPPNV